MKKFYTCLFILLLIQFIACNSPEQDKNLTQNTGWERIGPGGGGAMFWPAISPHDPDFAMVACDMTGSYVTYDGGISWKMFNLRGPVRFFVFDPSDPEIVYANSTALFRSNDRGKTWNILYPSPSGIRGIISRGDHADEIIVTTDSTRNRMLSLAIDPANSNKLHAIISVDRKILYHVSEDQGMNWTIVKEIEGSPMDIFIDPSSPVENRTVIITCINSVVVTKKGQWQTYKGVSGIKQINEYAAGFDKESNKFILYAISGKSYFNPEGDPSGIYYSEDFGRNWENRQNDILKLSPSGAGLPEWRAVATSSMNPRIVYVSYSELALTGDTICHGVAKSEDFGKTWILSWKDGQTGAGQFFTPNYTKGWIDDRFGPGWGENPFSIAVSPTNPELCFTTDFGRTIKTSDGGRTWEQVYTNRKADGGWISRGLDVTTGYNIVFDPFDDSHVFMAKTDIGLLVSNDGGESWKSVTNENGIPRRWVNSTYWLEFDREVKGRIFSTMSSVHDLPRPKMWRRRGPDTFTGGIVASSDGGKTWNPVSRDIGEAAITHILIDPESKKESRTLYACAFGKGVFKSVDGGRSWIKKNSGIEGIEPFVWRISRRKKGELLLIVCRRSDDGSIGNEFDGALYRSSDGAETWQKIGLPEGTNGPMDIICDESDNDRLILSAWGKLSQGPYDPDTGGGIFLSVDNGRSWKQTLSKDQHIHDITYDPRTGTYYACGFNGSAYRSDDRGETWSRLRGYNFKWGKRVEPDPRDPGKVFIITFGGGVWHGPSKGDQSAVEDILSPMSYKQ
jgi:photosystem II stability/assembly factor-like uncharacterized protein